MSFFYMLLLSVEKDDTSLYPKPKLFDIFLYPTLIVICKYILLIRVKKFVYKFSDYYYFQIIQFIKRKKTSKKIRIYNQIKSKISKNDEKNK